MEKEKSENCGLCRFWKTLRHGLEGKCRRFPPIVIAGVSTLESIPESREFYPSTKPNDWCGEYQPVPNKGAE